MKKLKITTVFSKIKIKKTGSRNPVNALTLKSSKAIIDRLIYKLFGESEAGLAELGRRTPLKNIQSSVGLCRKETERLSRSSGFKTLGLELRVPGPALNHHKGRDP